MKKQTSVELLNAPRAYLLEIILINFQQTKTIIFPVKNGMCGQEVFFLKSIYRTRITNFVENHLEQFLPKSNTYI